MKINVRKFQAGGEMPVEDPSAMGGQEMESGDAAGMAPGAEGGGQEQVMQQLAQLAQQIIQQLGPEAAMALAQMIMQMVQGGGAPMGPEQPTFQRLGGRIQRIK